MCDGIRVQGLIVAGPRAVSPSKKLSSANVGLTAHDRAAACQSRFFAALAAELRALLLAVSRITRHSRVDMIFRQGDRAHNLHVWVKLYRIAPNGAEAVVGVMTRAQCFGESVALRGDDYPVSADAATDCRLVSLPLDSLLALIRARPEVAISILSSALPHLQGSVAQIEQLKACSGAQRVAEFLLDLCPPESGAATVTLPYDKALIAG